MDLWAEGDGREVEGGSEPQKGASTEEIWFLPIRVYHSSLHILMVAWQQYIPAPDCQRPLHWTSNSNTVNKAKVSVHVWGGVK